MRWSELMRYPLLRPGGDERGMHVRHHTGSAGRRQVHNNASSAALCTRFHELHVSPIRYTVTHNRYEVTLYLLKQALTI